MGSSRFPTSAKRPFKRESRLCVKAGGKHPANCPTALRHDLGHTAMGCYTDDRWHMAHESTIVTHNGCTTRSALHASYSNYLKKPV